MGRLFQHSSVAPHSNTNDDGSTSASGEGDIVNTIHDSDPRSPRPPASELATPALATARRLTASFQWTRAELVSCCVQLTFIPLILHSPYKVCVGTHCPHLMDPPGWDWSVGTHAQHHTLHVAGLLHLPLPRMPSFTSRAAGLVEIMY